MKKYIYIGCTSRNVYLLGLCDRGHLMSHRIRELNPIFASPGSFRSSSPLSGQNRMAGLGGPGTKGLLLIYFQGSCLKQFHLHAGGPEEYPCVPRACGKPIPPFITDNHFRLYCNKEN